MGEYIGINGTTVKLGTCEDLYYVRYEELEHVIASGWTKKREGNLEPRDYLSTEGFRYRFPFPEEDGQYWTKWMERAHDKGLVVGVPPKLSEMDHDGIWHGVNANGGFNVNVNLPCPATKAFKKLKASPMPEHFPLAIKQQRRIGEELWLVVACGWCGHKVRLDAVGAAVLADYLKTYGGDKNYWGEVARRIMAGYKLAKEAH